MHGFTVFRLPKTLQLQIASTVVSKSIHVVKHHNELDKGMYSKPTNWLQPQHLHAPYMSSDAHRDVRHKSQGCKKASGSRTSKHPRYPRASKPDF